MEANNKKSEIFLTKVRPDLLKLLATTKGIELAEHAVPFRTELELFQHTPESQHLLSHIHSMFMDIEDSIMREYCSMGVLQISLTQHEIKKAKIFADQLQDREDRNTLKYFVLLKKFLLVTDIKNENFLLDDSQWEDKIRSIQKWTIDQAGRLSTKQFPESKVGDIRSAVSYYFEELVSVAGSPIEYDPIYSTPPGKYNTIIN